MNSAVAPEQPLFDVRPFVEDDRGFVRSSWKESHNFNGSRLKMPWRAWKETHGRDMDAILSRSDTSILVATDDNSRIAGWICWTAGRIPSLHYVYVRQEHRQKGLAWALFEASGMGKRLVYTFRGPRRRRFGACADVILVAHAQSRGIAATFVDAREFLR